MSQNDFDRHIRKQLAHHQSEVDAQDIWAALADKRPPRRRFVFWWFFAGLLLLSISVFGWQQDWWSNKQDINITPQEQLSSNDEKLKPEQTLSTKKQASKSANPKENLAENDTNTERLEEQLTADAEQKANSRNPSLDQKITRRNQQESKLADATTLPPVPKQISPKNSRIANTVSKDKQENSSPLTPNKTLIEEPPSTSQTNRNQVRENEEKIPPKIEDYSLQVKDRTADVIAPIDVLKPKEITIPDSLKLIEIPWEQHYKNSLPKSKGKMFFDLRMGLFKPIRTIEQADNNFGADWLAKREASEQLLDGWSIDLNIGYQDNRGGYFYTGLSYGQLIERFEYEETTSRIDSVDNMILEIQIDVNGDSTLVIGRGPQLTTETTYRRNFNSFRQFELPIMLGYRFSKKRLGLFAELGLRLNLQQEVEGIRHAQTSGFEDLSMTNNFRSKLGLSLQTGIGFSWHWTNQISLSANTNLRYHFGDVTRDNALIRERYHWLGGQLGLRWYF